jgi:hypothetical protein
MRDDAELVGLYRGNAEQLGREFRPPPGQLTQRYAGSTDMGNVSQVLPTIHPCSAWTACRWATSPSSRRNASRRPRTER